MSLGLSSSDVAYLNDEYVPESLIADETSNGGQMSNIFENCAPKGPNLEGIGRSSDQFVQSGTLDIAVPKDSMLQGSEEVRTQGTQISNNSPVTNTSMTSTSEIANQVADLQLIDPDTKASIASTNIVEVLNNLPGTSVTTTEKKNLNDQILYLDENNQLLQVPVEVLSKFAQDTPQVYILSMQFDDDNSTGNEEIKGTVKQTIEMLEEEDKLNEVEIKDLKEPQRASTPKFDENVLSNLDDTILEGNLQNAGMVLADSNEIKTSSNWNLKDTIKRLEGNLQNKSASKITAPAMTPELTGSKEMKTISKLNAVLHQGEGGTATTKSRQSNAPVTTPKVKISQGTGEGVTATTESRQSNAPVTTPKVKISQGTGEGVTATTESRQSNAPVTTPKVKISQGTGEGVTATTESRKSNAPVTTPKVTEKNVSQKVASKNGGKIKKSVADWITPTSTQEKTESRSHNDTYCREWVSQNLNNPVSKTAQNDSLTIEQDSCDSDLLDNVTSVSHCVRPKVATN